MKKDQSGFDGRIWPNLLDFNVNMDNQLTGKANFLFGAATLIFALVFNKLLSGEFNNMTSLQQNAWLVLLIGSFVSLLASMLIVLPRIRFLQQKERIKKDLFYYKNILHYYSREDYLSSLSNLPYDNKRIGEAYAHQIYSIATHVIPYKFRILKVAGWVLVVTILTSTILFFLAIV